jgi:hypothetical protein
MALHPQLDEIINRVLPVVQDFHGKEMFAPHAATIDKAGALTGRALTNDDSAQLSVTQAIDHFEKSFMQLAVNNEIQASGIFYHSSGIDASASRVSLPPATTTDECRTIVALLEQASGESLYLLIPYSGQPPTVEYAVRKLIEKPSKVFVNNGVPQAKPWWKLWSGLT